MSFYEAASFSFADDRASTLEGGAITDFHSDSAGNYIGTNYHEHAHAVTDGWNGLAIWPTGPEVKQQAAYILISWDTSQDPLCIVQMGVTKRVRTPSLSPARPHPAPTLTILGDLMLNLYRPGRHEPLKP